MEIELFPPAAAKELAPLRESKTPCQRLDDIDSQLSVSTYRDSDHVTWAHETCHGIASRIRGIEGPRTNGFYLFDGKYIVVKEIESFKLADVAKAIPQSVRRQVYQLYLVDQQKYWNTEPSYLLDEAYAYQNGTVVGMQLELFGKYKSLAAHKKDARYPIPFNYSGLNRTRDSFNRAQEMATYCVFMARAAAKPDISIAVDLLCQRTAQIAHALDGSNITPEYADFRAVWG